MQMSIYDGHVLLLQIICLEKYYILLYGHSIQNLIQHNLVFLYVIFWDTSQVNSNEIKVTQILTKSQYFKLLFMFDLNTHKVVYSKLII